LTTSPRRPSPAARAVRRSRRPAARQATFVERNRSKLLWGGGILAFAALVFVGLILPGLAPAYECKNIFDPTPAPSWTPPPTQALASGATPAPPATAPAPGYVEPDIGAGHVATGSKVTYTWCPPASGKHYNQTGFGPIRAGFYDQGNAQVPEGWVHNLEHGAIVLLYKCPGPACDAAGQDALESMYARWPDSPICGVPPGGGPNFTPVIARFDDMPYSYAAVVWDMVLPMETLNEADVLSFYAAYGERFNPERLQGCVYPTDIPPPAPPTESPSAAPSTDASSASSPAASPAESAAPSPAGS
jgi:Protein of unknown function (DUF3105)